eukprot:maker-scaffold895_size84271-snap-gene-0.27 protein:Tk08192 transcript:maker-scaffold895_size84271-snap-gene-0.27-mRNA-1 annotation:"membrane protein"
MLPLMLFTLALTGSAMANTQATYHPQPEHHHRPMQPRSGFGFNAGVGADNGLGVNGGFQVGNPLNSNILVPVVVGLGLLSFFNILLTIFTPLFSKKPAADKSDTAAPTAATTPPADPAASARMSRNMMYLANNVLEAIQKYQTQYNQE